MGIYEDFFKGYSSNSPTYYKDNNVYTLVVDDGKKVLQLIVTEDKLEYRTITTYEEKGEKPSQYNRSHTFSLKVVDFSKVSLKGVKLDGFRKI